MSNSISDSALIVLVTVLIAVLATVLIVYTPASGGKPKDDTVAGNRLEPHHTPLASANVRINQVTLHNHKVVLAVYILERSYSSIPFCPPGISVPENWRQDVQEAFGQAGQRSKQSSHGL
ncbi:hypothetical protein FIBSPDRAFT_1049878 [Athelia psychrophila]|uniref:Uncharacterized protein n=1 Tax=Athelia psychrophila TaxID=1759441 RepID=A0A166BJI9_9AGAM|nr:hypothetical protein FIBSPDRAFT_1049878 [Fibularhizoctonia sp. CBS 109695]